MPKPTLVYEGVVVDVREVAGAKPFTAIVIQAEQDGDYANPKVEYREYGSRKSGAQKGQHAKIVGDVSAEGYEYTKDGAKKLAGKLVVRFGSIEVVGSKRTAPPRPAQAPVATSTDPQDQLPMDDTSIPF